MEITKEKKRVLIITYYWPPSGGSGVQRCLKFVKYLRDFGWEPVVYTPENPEMPTKDMSFMADIPAGIEIIKTKIWEPYSFYKIFTGKKQEEKVQHGFVSGKEKTSVSERLAIWIRSNFFIPDARKFWVRPSVRYLSQYLEKHPVDVIMTSGPPHSLHLIGLRLHTRFPIPWVADFRDPWTEISYYTDLHLTKMADRKHHLLEKKVLLSADAVVVVGRQMAEKFHNTYGITSEVITNGFDAEDMNRSGPEEPDKQFSIVHTGLMNKQRNPKTLWKILSELASENPQFKSDLQIKLIGKTDAEVLSDIKKNDLGSCIYHVDYIPHDAAIAVQKQAWLLLIVINKTLGQEGIITGKLFEYLAAGPPVLCIGPTDGDAADIIQSAGAGITADYEDETAIRNIVSETYAQFLRKDRRNIQGNTNQFSRRFLTGKLATVLNGLILPRQ